MTTCANTQGPKLLIPSERYIRKLLRGISNSKQLSKSLRRVLSKPCRYRRLYVSSGDARNCRTIEVDVQLSTFPRVKCRLAKLSDSRNCATLQKCRLGKLSDSRKHATIDVSTSEMSTVETVGQSKNGQQLTFPCPN